MLITLDEFGVALRDVEVEAYCRDKLARGEDTNISQVIALDCFRALLRAIPLNKRPAVAWQIYGKEVHFDKDLRSDDAWNDPRTEIGSKFLISILSP